VSPKPNRGLGRGLEALLPKPEASGRPVAVDALRPSSVQPRQHFDEAALAELAASIASQGVLQPLLVRPVADGYEIVAGERRYRAAKRAGLASVPVIVRELDDRQALELAIVENLQRDDLNDLEEAEAYARLADFGLGQEEIARSVGKSRSSVANALRLLTLPDPAKRALRDGAITAGHARAILAQSPEDRAWALAQIVDRDLTVRQAEALARPTPSDAPPPPGRYDHLAEALTEQVGARVRIRGGRRGAIELFFHDEEELQGLLDLLGYRG
jgi:ParB family transcriptional regulator, chromosome partitioning protein